MKKMPSSYKMVKGKTHAENISHQHRIKSWPTDTIVSYINENGYLFSQKEGDGKQGNVIFSYEINQ